MNAGRLIQEHIADGLTLRRIGRLDGQRRLLEVVSETTSTNDLAWARAQVPASDGFIVFAEHQSAGRGRLGRTWESPRGASMMCSFLLFERDARNGPFCSLAAGIACAQAIRDATGVPIQLDWPNDLLVQGRKVGGILVESRAFRGTDVAADGSESGEYWLHVVGIGINCLQHEAHFPKSLRRRATSLDLESPHPIDRTAVARSLLNRLDHWFADDSWRDGQQLRRFWLSHAAPLGARVRLVHAGREYTGHVVDLDPTASLVVQLDEGGRCHFDAARTTIIRDFSSG